MHGRRTNWRLELSFADALILALSVASGLGSLLGLIKLMGGWHETGVEEKLAALMLVVILQSLLVFALIQWRQHKGAGALALYAVLVFNSVTMAAGFWGDILHLTQMHANQRFAEAITTSMTAFQQRTARFQDAAEISRELAATSTTLAKREDTTGYTCGRYPAGPGPRMRYRRRDADRFDAYAQHFTRRQQRFEVLLGKARTIATSRADVGTILDLRALIDEANGLITDPEVGAYKGWLGRRVKEAQVGVMYEGQVVRCPLPRLLDRLRAIRNISLAPIPSPANLVAPTATNSADIVVAYEASAYFVTLQLQHLSKPQIASLMFGMMIDLAIFWVATSQRKSERLQLHADWAKTPTWIRHLLGEPGHGGLPDALADLLEISVRRSSAITDVYLPLHRAHEPVGQLLASLEASGKVKWVRELRARRVPARVRGAGPFADTGFAHQYQLSPADQNEWIAQAALLSTPRAAISAGSRVSNGNVWSLQDDLDPRRSRLNSGRARTA